MFLKSVEMFGFKSFPERTTIEYDHGVTVIVGPNGCGKSNLSDAIRWVFGERSSREMRSGDKMTDVIFNGSTERAASGFAEVTLVLDNTDRSLDVDANEVSVTRRISRSGENEYFLNKKTVRLRDVEELFMDTGFGKDGYSLLNRSKIEAIMLGRKEERRKLFEEAAGISTHRYRREEAERNLKKADENMVRLTDIMDELEGRIGPLKLQAEKAEKFIALDGERKSLELGVLVRRLADSGDEIQGLERQNAILASKKAELELQSGQLKKRREALEEKRRNYGIQIDDLRRQERELNDKIGANRTQLKVAQNDEKNRGEQEKGLREEISRLEGEIASYGERIRENDADAERRRADCRQIDADVEALRQEVERLNREAAGSDQAHAALYEEINALNEACNRAREQQAELQGKAEQLRQRIGDSDSDKSERQRRLDEVEEEISLAEQDLEQIETEMGRHTNVRDGLRLKLDGLKTHLDEDEPKLTEKKIAVGQLRRTVETLEDMERRMEGYAGSVRAVLAAAQSGRLKGIRGTVAQLITVPDRYAMAIEVALGGALQNLVTENEQQAKYGIELLKSTNGGRATFLPMTTVSGNVLRENEIQGDYIGVAAELAEYAPEYRNIFHSLLGRVLVCENLDSAIAAARANRQRYRIVTLDGQVINAGGSMTGGSMNKNSGTLSRRNQIRDYHEQCRKLDEEIQELTQRIETRKNDRTRLENERNAHEQQLQGLASEQIRTQTNLEQSRKEAADLRTALENHDTALQQLRDECRSAEDRLRELQQQLERDSGSLEQKNAQARELEQGKSDITGRRDEINGQIGQKGLDKQGIEKDISALEGQNGFFADECNNRRERIAQIEEQIAGLTEQNTSGQESAEALRKENERLIEELNAAVAGIRLAEEQRDAGEPEFRTIADEESRISEDLLRISGDAGRMEEKLTNARDGRDGLIFRLNDEFNLDTDQAREQAPEVEDLAEATRDLNRLQSKIRALGQVNPGATLEYREVNERYTAMKKQYDDIVASQKELNKLITSLSETMTGIFTESFERINTEFKRVFEQLFGGGKAELLLDDPDNALESEITIRANPPGKKITSLEQLSTGERAFLTIAIYFAILHVKPTPFCLLDEIESNLDDVNVQRFADYMVEMSANTQFIAISHRRGTMEVGDVLYGVTMRKGSGISRLIRLEVGEVEQKLGIKI